MRPRSGSATPLEILLPTGGAVTTAACAAVASVLHGAPARVTAMVLVTGAFAAVARRPAAGAATAVIGWMLTTGFLVNGAGELTMSRADAARLAAFGAAGLGGAVLGLLPGLVRSRRRARAARARWRARREARRAPVLAGRLHPGPSTVRDDGGRAA
ncbi:hypothetical protein [Microbispora sp. ATCC PTA-5024]|uniref:hypothetical protein n=1 Tax=Microbispora sp. ATCC PTA-5024 TaxID=316330 RepID=UPI0003DD638F|nr:hypothetical protein [Microbispora sp. ATCC PTA-5024]ETK30527.1 hypothetical protein MPTA5024_39815 [Microbispora sp. ATCC PTA-5024]